MITCVEWQSDAQACNYSIIVSSSDAYRLRLKFIRTMDIQPYYTLADYREFFQYYLTKNIDAEILIAPAEFSDTDSVSNQFLFLHDGADLIELFFTVEQYTLFLLRGGVPDVLFPHEDRYREFSQDVKVSTYNNLHRSLKMAKRK